MSEHLEPGDSATSAGDIAAEWWRGLANDRGDRADLRRCGTVLQVQLLPKYHALARRLPRESADDWRAARLAVVAGLLAHVVEDTGSGSFPAMLATSVTGERSPFSGLRFRRLLACDAPDDLLVTFRRAIQVLGGRAPVASLANDLLHWNDRTRKVWAATYYRLAPSED